MFINEQLKLSLEEELSASGFANAFRSIADKHSELQHFEEPGDCIDFMQSEKNDHDEKEKVLSVLIGAYQENDAVPGISALLILIFWPALDHIYKSKRMHCVDDEELWHEIQYAFFESLSNYPLPQRPGKISTNLKLDTLKRVCRWQKSEYDFNDAKVASRDHYERRLAECEAADKDEFLDALNDAVFYGEPTHSPALKTKSEMLFRRFLDEGVISASEFDLILNTRLRGEEIKAYAERSDSLSYETARRQRSRAEEKLRKAWNRVMRES